MARVLPWPEPRVLAEAGVALACLVLVKAALIALDPSLRFFLGDSATYYYAAIDGWVPADRSFTYPWLIRYAVLPTGSAHALLWLQSLFGVACGLLLMLWLRWAGLPRAWALLAGLLCVLEPSQLFYERMMMAESAGQLALVAMLSFAAAYVGGARPIGLWIVGMALAGMAAVSMRMSLLPVVLGLSILTPFLRALCVGPVQAGDRRWAGAFRLVGHVLLVMLVTALVHGQYKSFYGRISGTEAAYMRASGQMRLGLVAPLVKREHIERAGLPADLLDRVEHRLDDPRTRGAQLWRSDGLWLQLLQAVEAGEAEGLPSPTPWTANLHAHRLASNISAMALKDDPIGLLRMGLSTFGDYFDGEVVRHRMSSDVGHRPVPEEMVESMKERLGYDASGMLDRPGPIARVFARSAAWLTLVLFLLAPLGLWLVWTSLRRTGDTAMAAAGTERAVATARPLASRGREGRAVRLVLGFTGLGLVASQLLFSHIVSFRYLQPFPPVLFACVFLIAWDIRARLRPRR